MKKESKNVVKQTNNRKNLQDKLKEALAKKPTASYINSVGLSPTQMQQLAATGVSKEKERLISERVVRNAKNRKRFVRPNTIIVDSSVGSYMESANNSFGASHEVIAPIWFRSTEAVDVSIIVPLYKSDEVIRDLIKTWPLKKNSLSYEIIFVDDQCPNNSKNAVLQAWTKRKSEIQFPIGKIICNSQNKGYGQACNEGAKIAAGEYLIFLNADTKVTDGWIEPMIELFKDPKVGLVGNMHLKEGGVHTGTIDSAGSEWKWDEMSFVHIGRHCYKKQGISNPFKLEKAPKDLLEVDEREMVTGCCFAISKKIFDYIGGFNPNYKIGYWEDSEICLNVRELGYKVMFQPNSIIYHKLGHTGSGGHKYFGHNKQYFMNKWVKSHRIDNLLLSEARVNSKDPVNTILVRRSNAHGDALIATGVFPALRKKYPNAKLIFSTLFPDVICENKYIDEFVSINDIGKTPFDVFYNLDYCYEWRPNVNIMTAYAEAVGVKTEDCKLNMQPQIPKSISLPDDFVIVHAGKTNWVGRDWPHENFVQIAQRLLDAGERVVAIGGWSEDHIPCTLNIKGQTSIAETAWVMSKAKAFVGIDSFPMHIAQAFDIPGVSFFGCILPESRIYSKNMQGINAKNLSCIGCHHRKPTPSTVTQICETGTLDCIKGVTVEDMWKKVKTLLRKVNNENLSVLG